MFESLLGVHGPKGVELGSQRAMLNQNAGYSSRFATTVPFCVGVGSVFGSRIFHCMLFPEPGVFEKNSIRGSSCPT